MGRSANAFDALGPALASAPRVASGIDLTRLSLDARDGYVLSRIDGSTPASILCDLVGVSPRDLADILRRLVSVGAVEWEGAARLEASAPSAPEGRRVRGEADSQAALQAMLEEPGELSRAERLHIAAKLRDIEERTLWHVLELRGDPTPADIKRAYFNLSKRYHPDRYFGRDLGRFQQRLHRVFEGIKEAYDVLGDPRRCAEYKARVPPPVVSELPDPLARRRDEHREAERAAARAAQRERLEERRAQIVAERRARQAQPLAERRERARELFEAGIAQLQKGELTKAAASLQLAASFDPNNAEYAARYEEVQRDAVRVRTKDLLDRADMELATGQTAAAARLVAQAADLSPQAVSHALRAAELFHKAGDRERARSYAERAVRAGPRRFEARVALAEILEEQGDLEAALAHYEVASSLEKGDARVKKAIKRLTKKARS